MSFGRSRLPWIAPAVLGLACVVSNASAQSDRVYRTVSSSRQPLGERDFTVEARFALGHFNLTRDQSGALYRTTLLYDEALFEPEQTYDSHNRVLTVDLTHEEGRRSRNINLRNLRDLRQRLDIALAPSVPARVNLEFGVVRADIDFGGMSLIRSDIKIGASEVVVRFSRPTIAPCERLHVTMGAAEFSAEQLGNSNCAELSFEGAAGALALDFSGEWQHEGKTAARVKLGFGTLKLQFPSHLGVAISIKRFLASFDGSGFVKRGDTYYSRNYDSATAQLDLDINAVLGDIEVVWVPR